MSRDFDAKSAAHNIEHLCKEVLSEGANDTRAELELSQYVQSLTKDPVNLLAVEQQLASDQHNWDLLPVVGMYAAPDGHAIDIDISRCNGAAMTSWAYPRAQVEINLNNKAWSVKKESVVPFVNERHKGNY